mmetsp:Transcript_40072/g.126744  ORF Transcript_40072/g.126744 Transcript_40072/m.126744 type:complete len:191 (+) Transcript_40072:514-1086(+)
MMGGCSCLEHPLACVAISVCALVLSPATSAIERTLGVLFWRACRCATAANRHHFHGRCRLLSGAAGEAGRLPVVQAENSDSSNENGSVILIIPASMMMILVIAINIIIMKTWMVRSATTSRKNFAQLHVMSTANSGSMMRLPAQAWPWMKTIPHIGLAMLITHMQVSNRSNSQLRRQFVSTFQRGSARTT